MNVSRLLLFVLALAGGVAATIFFLRSPAEPKAVQVVGPGDVMATSSDGLHAGGAGLIGAGEGTADGEAREEARRALDTPTRAVTVVVHAPAGAPPDPELAVVAVPAGDDLDDDDVRELFALLRTSDAVRAHEAVRVLVGSDGRARLPLNEGVESTLFLDGRFLYLDEPVELVADERTVELEPLLGACIVVTIADTSGVVEGKVAVIGGSFGRGGGRNGWRRDDEPTNGGELVFRALDPELTWTVAPSLEAHHAEVEIGLELEPGEERAIVILPTAGASVSGVVVDDGGAPLAGAEVSTVNFTPWMGGLGGRETTTDEDGRFVLRAVAPGEQQLEAELSGWRSSRSDELELEQGQQVELVLTLDRGEIIAGVVRLPDGSPAAEARIVVEARRSGGGWGNWGGGRRRRAGSTESGSDGAFRVSGLDEGAYTVRAAFDEVSGKASGKTGDVAVIWRDVEEGVASGTMDVQLELVGPVAFVGRVVDDRGEPVAQFELEVDSVEDGGPREREAFEDEDGRFVFARVGPGEWTVTVEAEGHVHPDEALVSLPGDGLELELVLERTARLAGRVVDVGGAPVAGASVRADDGGSSGNPWAGMSGPRVESGGDGHFVLEDLAPGTLYLTASAEAWADSLPLTCELVPGTSREGVELVLRVGGRIEGAVLTPEGDPVADQRVTWGRNAMGFGSRAETRTDSAGRFAFEHVTPGDWSVSAAPSMAEMGRRMRGRRSQSAFTEVMGQLVTETVTVLDGETVEVYLGGEPRQPVRVFGVVTLAGDPVEDATVVAVSEGSAVFQGMKSVQSAADGSFELVVDRPGPHVISARSARLGVEAVVEIPRQEELRVNLAIPLGRIEGVVRKPGGRPAPGVRLSIQREDGLGRMRWGGEQTTADETGAYSIEALQAGRYTVRANVAGWGGRTNTSWGSSARSGIEVDADETVTGVDFMLEEAGVVAGVVVDPSGVPVDGASLFFRDAAGLPVARVSGTLTNAGGEFRQEGLAPGEYSISARATGHASGAPVRVVVAAGEQAEARVALESATMLVISLEQEGGTERRARFEVLDEDGVEVGSLMTLQEMQTLFNEGSSGLEQRVGPLTAGRYTVRATTADGRTVERRVRLRGRDGEKKVRLKLD